MTLYVTLPMLFLCGYAFFAGERFWALVTAVPVVLLTALALRRLRQESRS